MIIYRLYAENINKDKIREIVSKRFDEFTMIEAQGYWKGNKENNLVIEIVADKFYVNAILIKEIAREICEMNKQERVMVIDAHVNQEFIGKGE